MPDPEKTLIFNLYYTKTLTPPQIQKIIRRFIKILIVGEGRGRRERAGARKSIDVTLLYIETSTRRGG